MHREHLDQIVCLERVPWAQYEALLRARGESSVPRLTYLEGSLEIMSPGMPHDGWSRMLLRLLTVYAEEQEIALNAFGSWTVKDKRRKSGLEPDECFIIGPPAGRKRPDLAIEVVSTHSAIDKLEIYRRLGVGEVWRYEWPRLSVHLLRRGRYVGVKKSEVFPALDLDAMLRFLDLDDQMAALRAWRKQLRRR
jgi:Uma2 family endonuclease